MTPIERTELEERLRAREAELVSLGPVALEPATRDSSRSAADEDEAPLAEMLQAIASGRNRNHDAELVLVRKALFKLRDAPESYGVYAWWMNRRVELTAVPPASNTKPFLIVYGDAPMHEKIPGTQLSKLLGENVHDDYDSISEWKKLCQRYSVWFLRRPTGRTDDATEKQWRKAVGAHFLHIHDEARAIDYALGIVAWHWGHLADLRANMLARQPEAKVNEVLAQVQDLLENRR